MENDVVDVEPDRVRILSSLDGRRSRPGRGSRGGVTAPSRAPARWWSHVLLGLMGMGLFTVALAVFLIIKSSRESDLPLTRWDVTAPQATASMHDPDALLNSQPPGAGLLSEEVAEAETFGLLHQDSDAQAATMATVATTTPSAPAMPTDAASEPSGGARIEPLPVVVAAPAKASSPTEPKPAESKPAVAPVKPTAPTVKAAAKPPEKSPAKPAALVPASAQASSSADVRLLEAVFPKHDPRKATKAELFKACQGMAGAEAAICRARICVQHPGVPACQ